MGLFKHSSCIHCGKWAPVLYRYKTSDHSHYVCDKCLKGHVLGNEQEKLQWVASLSVDQLIHEFKRIESKTDENGKYLLKDIRSDTAKQFDAENSKYNKLLTSFKSDATSDKAYKIGRYYVDSKRQEILKARTITNANYQIYKFSDISSVQPIQQGESKTKKHGITRAVVGGALAGGVGAIVGAATGGKQYDYITKLGFNVTFKNGEQIYLDVMSGKFDTKGPFIKAFYKQFNAIHGWLDTAVKQNNSQNVFNSIDPADEIAKFKKLLDAGAITQEEFEAKKKQLLGL